MDDSAPVCYILLYYLCLVVAYRGKYYHPHFRLTALGMTLQVTQPAVWAKGKNNKKLN